MKRRQLTVWHARRWAANTLGAVVCWWKSEHDPIWTMGSVEPLGAPDVVGEHWQGTYCLRCGKVLSGQPFGPSTKPSQKDGAPAGPKSSDDKPS